MRIRRIRIREFGGIKDRDYSLSEGATVFYGPNESGKTSTMEFIRTVLSPTKKKRYPDRSKREDGSLEIEDDGASITIALSSKGRAGVPECIGSMDPDVYRKIFAMDPDSLNDSNVVSGGEIRSRFLTIPGGDGVPAAIEWADGSVQSIIGLRSNSPSELLDIDKKISETVDEIATMKASADRYGELAKEKAGKEALLKEMESSAQDNEEIKRIYENYRNNADNYRELARLKSSRAALGQFMQVAEADISTEIRLTGDLEHARKIATEKNEVYETVKAAMGGVGPRSVDARERDIRSMEERLPRYRQERRELDTIESTRRQAALVKPVRKISAIAIAGLIIAVLGIAGIIVTPYSSALAIIGVAVVAVSMRKTSGSSGTVRDDSSAREAVLRESTGSFESDLDRLCSDLGQRAESPESKVELLSDLLERSKAVSNADRELMKAKSAESSASADLAGFYSRFSGKEGFDHSKMVTKQAEKLDLEIGSLEESIRRAGLDPEKPDCPVSWTEDGSEEVRRQIAKNIGALGEQMKTILNMTALEASIDRLAGLKARRSEIMRRGAVALIAKELLNRSCGDAFEDVQPSVVSTADKYFRMMTGGCSSLEIDPKDGILKVTDGNGSRDERKWSTGLRSQALLSIKLAIAKEMGGGSIPVILDDVLLPFDSERKAGALKAIGQISSEMQVIMFTCDAETKALAEAEGIAVTVM